MNIGGKRYYGKVFGGLLGFMLMRHPFGLLLGGLLGHAFDAGWFQRKPRSSVLDQAYAELEVSPSASNAAIDAAYRRLMSKYHPDRLADASEEIRTLAEQRSRAINVAYDLIMKTRNEAR